MAKNVEEYIFSLLKRRKLINMLNESGFILVDNEHGQHVYVANPGQNHPKILGHYLPVAFVRRFYFKLVNLDEPVLRQYHEKFREIHSSLS